MESLSLSDLRRELQRLSIDAATPGLSGDARRFALLDRLRASENGREPRIQGHIELIS